MSASSHISSSTTQRTTVIQNNFSLHSGSGTLRGGGVSKIYGNMATLKQYKRKIDYRLPLVTIICLMCISMILFIYGLYQLKGHDIIVEYIENTKNIINTSNNNRHKREDGENFVPKLDVGDDPIKASSEEIHQMDTDQKSNDEDDVKKQEKLNIEMKNETLIIQNNTDTTTETLITTDLSTISNIITTTTIIIPTTNSTQNKLTLEQLDEMYNDFVSTYITIWNLFGINLIVLLFLIPATILFHIDFININKYKIIFRIILILTMLFLIIQLFYLISPLLTCSCLFPEYIDELFDKKTTPKFEEGIEEIKDSFACEFNPHEALVVRGIEDPCLPKIKDSLFPCYATVVLIVLDILPFIFAFFTYAWDAWIKDCTTVREARMRVELNNQRRPQTREQLFEQALQFRHSGNSSDDYIL